MLLAQKVPGTLVLDLTSDQGNCFEASFVSQCHQREHERPSSSIQSYHLPRHCLKPLTAQRDPVKLRKSQEVSRNWYILAGDSRVFAPRWS